MSAADEAKDTPQRPKAEPSREEPRPTPRSNRDVALIALLTLGLVALDLGTKAWAESALSRERLGTRPEVCSMVDGMLQWQRRPNDGIVLVDGMFELTYAENCGAAFSLLNDAPRPVALGLFGTVAVLATVALFWGLKTGTGGSYYAAAVPLVASGALGNLADRVRYGYVVDFIHAHWEGVFDYPVFNVADIAVVVGVVLLVIDSFRTRPRAQPTPAEPKPA